MYTASVAETSGLCAQENRNQAIYFPRGLPGLETYHHFRVEALPDNRVFSMLRSTEEAGLALILVDPFPFIPGYRVELAGSDLAELEINGEADVLIFTTVTVGKERLFTNLAAPIVINAAGKRGKQLVLPERSEELRVPLVKL
ncbi:MAG: flagellar assembly protein FliW [Bacillota bacterium]